MDRNLLRDGSLEKCWGGGGFSICRNFFFFLLSALAGIFFFG